MLPPKVVAEIGCNHKGDLEIARQMIDTAASFAGVDYVKFQKRNNRELLSEKEYGSPHPVPENSYGATYGEHRDYLEFDVDQHRQLARWCVEAGTRYATSVWDLTSAAEIASIECDFVKVPSACNLHVELLQLLATEFRGDVHISLGMTTPEEADSIVALMEENGAGHRAVLYACTSGYPVAAEDVCLLEIERLQDRYGQRVKAIGFSGHHLGIAIDIAAMTLGAQWIERHFTLDRTWKGTDHAASLEPDGLRRLVRDTRAVGKALSRKPEPILSIEQAQRQKLKRLPGVHVS